MKTRHPNPQSDDEEEEDSITIVRKPITKRSTLLDTPVANFSYQQTKSKSTPALGFSRTSHVDTSKKAVPVDQGGNFSVGARKRNTAVRKAEAGRVLVRDTRAVDEPVTGRRVPTHVRIAVPIVVPKAGQPLDESRFNKRERVSQSVVSPAVLEEEGEEENVGEKALLPKKKSKVAVEESDESESENEQVAIGLGVPPASPRRTRSGTIIPTIPAITTPTKPKPGARPTKHVPVSSLPTPSPSPAKRPRTKSPTSSVHARRIRTKSPTPSTYRSSPFFNPDDAGPSQSTSASCSSHTTAPEIEMAEASSDSDDELDLLQSPTKGPTRAAYQTPTITPRASNRILGLPASKKITDSAPIELRIDIVGFHDIIMQNPTPVPSPSKRTVANSSTKVAAVGKGELGSRISAKSKDKGKGKAKQNTYEPTALRGLFSHLGKILGSGPILSTSNPTNPTEGEEFDFVPHYQKWEKPVRYAMRSVIKQKVGNCLIVLGQKGVGKTMIVERSVKVMSEQFGSDQFVVVRISGLVHTTDRLALRAIARQLKFGGFDEDNEADTAGDWASSASTMSTLLAMLEPGSSSVSSTGGKPIILIVDEFDLFALHPRQSFLYSLLDIVQGNRRKAGMGVIGLSSRTDCLSLLEKRVRSRCQSQVHQLVPVNSWENFMELAASLLTVGNEHFADGTTDMVKEWNAEVERFLNDEDTREYLNRLWTIHGNVPVHLRQALTSVVARLEWSTRHTSEKCSSSELESMTVPSLTVDLLPSQSAPRHRDDLLSQLSTLELTVCVAAKYMRIEHDNTFNLEMLYNCYHQHTRRHSAAVAITRPYSKHAFAMALDNMRSLEIFLPCVGKPSHYFLPSLGDSFRMLRFVPWAATLDEEIAARPDVPLPTRRWCKNWAE